MTRATGFKAARKKSKARTKRLKQNVSSAISVTVQEVHRSGKSNIRAMVNRRSGNLLKGYRKKVSRSTLRGMVGYINAAARRSAFYARFIHDGTSRSRAFPFHDAAVLEHEGRHQNRMRAASADALDDRASPSRTGRSGGGVERSLE